MIAAAAQQVCLAVRRKRRVDDPATVPGEALERLTGRGIPLCADSYCLRYRPAARRPQQIDTGMSNIGFRCVVRASDELRH